MIRGVSETYPCSRGRVCCDACQRVIPAGQTYLRQVNADRDRIWTWKACHPCQIVTEYVLDWVGPYYGAGSEDFEAWALEALADPTCDHHAAAHSWAAQVAPQLLERATQCQSNVSVRL